MPSTAYRLATSLAAPLLPLWLAFRKSKGKEDPRRLRERYGIASRTRPKGTLVWLHAASVGEANSVLPLIRMVRERFLHLHILLTTGTVTSAELMQTRLPREVIHQYLPLDTMPATKRFIRHWKPDIALFVESELWPNLLAVAKDSQCYMGVINARMSERSFTSWQKRKIMIRDMLSSFYFVFAQSENDAARLKILGARNVMCVGNLKYDGAALPCDESELFSLKDTIGRRPVWLAASTHPGEEKMVADAHKLLSVTRPNLLTIVVPRHPQRGAEVAAMLKDYGGVALRSLGEPITSGIAFYVADTLGELGLFYRLSEIAFMGGSLVRHGGQNPLEPARLSCAVVTGPYTHNFAEMYLEMEKSGTAARAKNSEALAAQIDFLLNHPAALSAMQEKAKKWVEEKAGAARRLFDAIAPIFDPASYLT